MFDIDLKVNHLPTLATTNDIKEYKVSYFSCVVAWYVWRRNKEIWIVC